MTIIRPIILLLLIPLFLFSREGIQYTHLQTPGSCGFFTPSQSIHIIEINPSLYEIKPAKALGKAVGRESVLAINNRYHGIASINGGFFKMGGIFDGLPSGILKIHDWYSLPFKQRGCIGWSSNNQNPIMNRLLVIIEADYENRLISIDGLNRDRKNGEMVLFNPSFNKTTMTTKEGEEIIVVNGVIQNIVREGNSIIPKDGYVLSIQETHPLFGNFEIGKPLSFSTYITPQIAPSSLDRWDDVDYIVGGCPLLIYKGSKIVDFTVEQTISSFLHLKHARSAVGILSNGNWVFVVVEKTNLFEGMTINELADFMMEIGCFHALNLDGGGSSTMVYEGQVKNTNYGDHDEINEKKQPRLVSDAIVVLSKDQHPN